MSARTCEAAKSWRWPAAEVELPWGEPTGEPVCARLLITTRESKALNRNYVNQHLWHPAVAAAGIEPSRQTGMHQLRHWWASTLLEGGVSIKAVSENLGHADAGFTARTYTHLMPTSGDRARETIAAALSGAARTSADAGTDA